MKTVNQRKTLLKTILAGLMAGFLLAGCGPGSSTPIPTPYVIYITPTPDEGAAVTATGNLAQTAEPDTVTPAPSPTPTATLTATPGPTATPVPLGSDAISPDVNRFMLPPVTQHVTTNTAVIHFRTMEKADGVMVVSPADGSQDAQVFVLDGSSRRQQISVGGLFPETEYEVTVGVLSSEESSDQYLRLTYSGEQWGPIRFRTLPGGDQPLRIAVLGDSGFGEQITYDIALRIADLNPHFVIHTGDLVYKMDQENDAHESYRLKWYLPMSPILHKAPIYQVVGNHDIEEDAQVDGEPFYYHVFRAFPNPDIPTTTHGIDGHNQWYAFGYGNTQFIFLDTQTFFGEAGHPEQTEWLRERLADDRFSNHIPVHHVPLYTSGLHPGGSHTVRQGWEQLYVENGVRLILSGHDHNYQRIEASGITHIVSGGGSSALYPAGDDGTIPESHVFAERSHFVMMELQADVVDLTAYSVNGEILDQTQVTLAP